MAAIVVKQFGGLKPIVSARLLAASEAQIANNVRSVSGSLLPMRGTTTLQALQSSSPATIYRYGTSATESNYWLEFSQDTDVMRSPIAADQYDRLYWTNGNGVPRYAPNSLILQAGSGAYPRASYQLGIPAPSAPSAVGGATAAAEVQTFSISAAQISALGASTKLKVVVTTASASPETILTINSVSATSVAAALSTVTNLTAVEKDGGVVITPGSTVTKVSISIKTGTQDNYDAAAVTYTSYLQPGDTYNLIAGARIFAVVDGSLIRGAGSGLDFSTFAPAAVLFSPSVIAAIPVGSRIAIQVNGGSQVAVTVQAGTGTYPPVVTPQSLAAAFAGVTGTETETISNGAYTINGNVVTGQFVILRSTLAGNNTTILVRRVTPATADVYGSPNSWVRNTSEPAPETRVYVCTYVSAYGEEGPPSPASTSISVVEKQQVTITLPGSPTGSYNITLKRIYRSSTVGSTAQFQFVAEVPVATGSYVDSKSQADLGEVLMTEDWVAPPAGLKGLRVMANGASVGFVGKTLYFSEPNLPHAWPHQYPIDFDIVGIATYGQFVAVLTTSYPYIFEGVDPAAMTSRKLNLPQACVAKRSIVETGNGVIYASPDGLVEIGTQNDVVTRGLLSRDQWQAYVPSSMECYLYNGRVHTVYNTGSGRGMLVFDFSGQGATLTTNNFNLTTATTAGFYDASTDKLYFAQGSNIVRFDQGSNQTYAWRSKVFRLDFPTNFGFAQVNAYSYPVTLKVYADGVLQSTNVVANNNQFRLPSGFRAYEWYFDVEGTGEVIEVAIAQSTSELKSV